MARMSIRPRRRAIRAGICAGAALLLAAPCASQVRDVEMKAAYIYNFAQFTIWPEARAREPLAVCADRAGVLWPTLQAYNGKPVHGRTWQLFDAGARLPGGCDVLVLARSAEPAPPASGMLVVRDGASSAPAAITLIDDDEQLRFDIDTREAARNGLRLSSKLLRLARTVL